MKTEIIIALIFILLSGLFIFGYYPIYQKESDHFSSGDCIAFTPPNIANMNGEIIQTGEDYIIVKTKINLGGILVRKIDQSLCYG